MQSIRTTSWPKRSTASHTWLPMTPAAPVTTTFMMTLIRCPIPYVSSPNCPSRSYRHPPRRVRDLVEEALTGDGWHRTGGRLPNPSRRLRDEDLICRFPSNMVICLGHAADILLDPKLRPKRLRSLYGARIARSVLQQGRDSRREALRRRWHELTRPVVEDLRMAVDPGGHDRLPRAQIREDLQRRIAATLAGGHQDVGCLQAGRDKR